MSEPTSILTFYDLILRTAELASVAYYGSSGNDRAMIPIDVHEFDRCKRVVNDGIMEFIANAPETGWRWKNRIMQVTFGSVQTEGTVDSVSGTPTDAIIDDALIKIYTTEDEIVGYYVYDLTKNIYGICTAYAKATGTVTCGGGWLDWDDVSTTTVPVATDSYSITDVKTVEGDKARYLLSEDFGSVTGKLTYAKDSSRGHCLEWRSEGQVRANREVSVSTGYPQIAAVRRYRNRRRWEIIVNPSPTATDTILFPYEVGLDKLQMECGTGDAGGTTYITDADRWEPEDYFNGWVCSIISGTGRGSYAAITDYESRDGAITGWTDNGDKTYTAASANLKVEAGDVVTVAGASSDFNGTHVITSVVVNTSFTITLAAAGYTVTSITGTWKQRQLEVTEWLKSDGEATGISPDETSVYYVEPAYNKHPAGLLFDEVIVSACKAQAEMQYDDVQAGYVQKYYSVDLLRAQDADKRTAPRKLGKMGRGGRGPVGRNWDNVPYYDSSGTLMEA